MTFTTEPTREVEYMPEPISAPLIAEPVVPAPQPEPAETKPEREEVPA